MISGWLMPRWHNSIICHRIKAFVHWFVKVNHIEKGINPSSVKEIYFSGDYLGKGFKIGVMAGMIGLTVSKINIVSSLNEYFAIYCYSFVIKPWYFGYQEAIAIGRTLASMKDYQLDGNRNGCIRSNECCWFHDFLLCSNW